MVLNALLINIGHFTAVKNGTGTITWSLGNNYSTVSFSGRDKSQKADKCTPPPGGHNWDEVVLRGTVTGGNVADLVGGRFKETVCEFIVGLYSNFVEQTFPGTEVSF